MNQEANKYEHSEFEAELRKYEAMWTTDKDQYELLVSPGKPIERGIPLQKVDDADDHAEAIWLIDNSVIAEEVCRRMAAAGVPIVNRLPRRKPKHSRWWWPPSW